MQPRMSGEWHTGEVVNLCKSYGFIRISKDGKSEEIFFYYGDVKGREPQLWFANNRTSPKTGAVLPHGSLIPNHAAKAMISDFLDEARRHQAALDASMADEVKGAP